MQTILLGFNSEEVSFLNNITDQSKLYLVNPDNAENMEIEKITHSYIIDGITDKIYLVGGYSRDDKIVVYEYNQIVNLYNSTFGVRLDAHILLPNEFTQVEYIESTGEQFIDAKFTDNSPVAGYYIKYQNSANHSGDDVVIGVMDQNRLINTNNTLANAVFKESGTGVDGVGTRVPVTRDDIIETYLNFCDSKTREIVVNGTSMMSVTLLSVTTTNSKSCYIFAANYGTPYGRANGVRVFNAKISLNQDIVRDFIPCYCNATVTDVNGKSCPAGTIGLYDIVEGEFYTNQGDGTFLKGNDV